MRFHGHVVVVTGAARGIGAAIARAFAADGARLALLDVDADGLDALVGDLAAKGGDVAGLRCDVTVGAEVRGAFDRITARFGRIDVLVNNAGGFSRIRATEDIPDEEWDAILRFNLTSVFLCTKAVLPIMKRQRAGRIVNLASVVGRSAAVSVTTHYAAAKAGVLGFTRNLAREVGPDGITVNAVAPGTVGTERFWALRSPEETRRIAESVPLRRVAEPEEIAHCVLFLASDGAGYMTGAALDVNGGMVML
jgi:NAD(P)-dependent dehydrogenase (short-subunit alcohol dehydrogenase family)